VTASCTTASPAAKGANGGGGGRGGGGRGGGGRGGVPYKHTSTVELGSSPSEAPSGHTKLHLHCRES